MPDALVTLLRVTNRSRPQRKKSAASNTGSNSVRMYETGSPLPETRKSGSNSSSVSCGLGAAVHRALRRFDHDLGEAETCKQSLGPRGHTRNVARDNRMIGRDHRTLKSPDDDFFERIPFVM